jgi:NADPH:quinone reductase-like Zn-dependent oxidoreductase
MYLSSKILARARAPEGGDMASPTMTALRLHARPRTPADRWGLELEDVPVPRLQGGGEVLVRVRAAAITRDELEWHVDRLPAIPSYEVSGVVTDVSPDVSEWRAGDEVYALTPFDRDGAAAQYVAVPASVLARKPASSSHVEAAAVPMPALTAWQGLFDHGGLTAGERVLVLGAAGGVGHAATQLAREHGAHVVGATSGARLEAARDLGAHEVVDDTEPFGESLEPVDLVFDTVGGDALTRSFAVARPGGRIVSVAEEPPHTNRRDVTALYFVVEPSRDQLAELARVMDAGRFRPEVDSVYALAEASAAFTRVHERGKRGKVVFEIP